MAEGYIADVRSISGTGVYTGNFSIPKLGLLQKSGSASATVYSNTTNINTTFSDTNCQLLSLQYKQPHNNHGFQDSSTNNHLITRNGNTTQGTFSPFSPAGWSLSFTSGNGITVPTSIATSLASSGATFTIEAWVYLNSYGSAPTNQEYYNRAIFGIGNTYGAFLIDSTGKLNLYSYDGTGRFTTSTGTVALRTWTHVAASVTGGVIKLFIDGTLSGTGTWYGHIGGAITTCIGSTSDTNAGTNRHFDGYIASFRLSNIARYNISFNKPTSLYTTDANTVILTGQLNRLVDESNSPQTLTNVSAS
ncbi:MAG: LamG domain-containing protein, partial [Verrucomicrobia bacterium]|nr:LamG domain-containing protein [Verrucomicrobiota bacterium]